MKLKIPYLIAPLFFAPLAPLHAVDFEEDPAVAAIFEEANPNATFVVHDVSAGTFTGYNGARAEERFIPASTFKIPNSLIGLTTGAVESVDEILPYGGGPQFLKEWEQDMGLRDAIKISNVPVYKELARRIGLEPMQEMITRLDYGNGEIGEVVDNFWLVGPLKISAIEQTQFLARLVRNELPVPVEHQEIVREIVKLEEGPGYTLYAKTGWLIQAQIEPQIGWWVGWVEKDGNHYTFALNMDMPEEGGGPLRIKLGKASLQALKILPAEPAAE